MSFKPLAIVIHAQIVKKGQPLLRKSLKFWNAAHYCLRRTITSRYHHHSPYSESRQIALLGQKCSHSRFDLQHPAALDGCREVLRRELRLERVQQAPGALFINGVGSGMVLDK